MPDVNKLGSTIINIRHWLAALKRPSSPYPPGWLTSMIFVIHTIGTATIPETIDGKENFHKTDHSPQMLLSYFNAMPNLADSDFKATLYSKIPNAAFIVRDAMAPCVPYNQTRGMVITSDKIACHMLIIVIFRNDSNPEKTAGKTPLMVVVKSKSAPAPMSEARSLLFIVFSASQSDIQKQAIAIMPLVIMAIMKVSVAILPARCRSLILNSAIYFVAVVPNPKPAKKPNMPIVDWTIPSSPYPSFPSNRATIMDETIVSALEAMPLIRAQKALRANL